jgi:signal transduction histidine kinase
MERMLNTAGAGIQRIAATVELLGTYSREGYARALRHHDVFSGLADVVGLVHRTTGRNVQVSTSHEGEGLIECVPEEWNQVVTNLTQNAIEVVPEASGAVTVRGWCEGDQLLLSVKDNGPGISAEDQQRIFTPFFTTKAPGRGMGLGLTIVWRVVTGLGGNVRVTSAPGAGTEFVVRVPRAVRTARAAEASRSA